MREDSEHGVMEGLAHLALPKMQRLSDGIVAIFTIGFMAVVAAAILSAYSYLDRAERLERQLEGLYARTILAAGVLDARLSLAQSAVYDAARSSLQEIEGNGTLIQVGRRMRERILRDGSIDSLALYDGRGELLVSGGSDREVSRRIDDTAAYYSHVFGWVTFLVDGDFTGAAPWDDSFTVSLAVEGAEGFNGIMVLSLKQDPYEEALQATGEPLWAAVLNDNPSPLGLTGTDPSADFLPDLMSCTELAGSFSGTADCAGTTFAFHQPDASPITVVAVPDRDTVLSEWFRFNFIPSLIAVTIILGTSLYSTLQVHRRARHHEAARIRTETARRFLQNILASAPDGIITINQSGNIVTANEAAAAIFGYEIRNFLGTPVGELVSRAHAGNHDGLVANYMQGSRGNAPETIKGRQVVGRRMDGSEFPVHVSVSVVEDNEEPFAVAIVTDVSLQERQQKQLELQNRLISKQMLELEEATGAQRRFMAAMSHEIRTPMNAIIGFSDMLRTVGLQSFSEEQVIDYLRDIHRSGEHLLSIINDLLDVARLSERGSNLRLDPVDVRQTVGQAVSMSRSLFDGRTVVFDSIGDGIVVSADQRALSQILLNFLSNAIKFTKPAIGRIEIGARVDDNRITISVLDNGIGIPADMIGQLAKPFQQVDAHWEGSARGLGLGLSLCRLLAEEMNGLLKIESEEGAWTKVSVVLNGTEA